MGDRIYSHCQRTGYRYVLQSDFRNYGKELILADGKYRKSNAAGEIPRFCFLQSSAVRDGMDEKSAKNCKNFKNTLYFWRDLMYHIIISIFLPLN